MKSVKTSELRKLHNFHLWVNPGLPRKELIKVNFEVSVFSLQETFLKAQTPTTFFLSQSKKTVSASFSSARFTHPLRNWVRKKFLYLLILEVSTHETKWKPFCWPFSFLSQTSFFSKIKHLQSRLSYLSKHFPWGCAFCLFLKLFSGNFYIFMNFDNFSLFFILRVCRQHTLVLRNLVVCN